MRRHAAAAVHETGVHALQSLLGVKIPMLQLEYPTLHS